MGITKLGNEYAQSFDSFDAPKAVWMAIAASFAARIHGEDFSPEAVQRLIAVEWLALHQNGIVPQRPPAQVRQLATKTE